MVAKLLAYELHFYFMTPICWIATLTLAMTIQGNVPCLFEFLEKEFFLKFLGKTDFLREQEPIANCALVEILMSLKLCVEF